MVADLLDRPLQVTRPPVRRPRRAVGPLVVALLLSIGSGVLLALAYPAANIWVLAFPGVAGLLLSLRGRSFWSGVLVGFAGGMAYYLALISWVSLFLGPVPLLALAGLMSIYMGLGGGLIAIAYRAVPAVWTGRWGRLGVTPFVVAACWEARESVANTFPYGGFAWGRVSLSQATSPFAPLVAWVGLSGLTFLLVWLTAFALAVVLEPRATFGRIGARRTWSRAVADALPKVFAVALAVAALLAIPRVPLQQTGSIRVAGIQANTKSGYFQASQVAYPGQILDQNIRATLPVVVQRPDLVVWPEGASDLSPLTSEVAASDWTAVARVTGVPLLGGVITDRGGKLYNSSLLWDAQTGPTAIYDKVHPVPFGEYVPDRAFWTPFAPDLLKLIGRDYTIGTRSPVLTVGETRIGVNICFDIEDDGLMIGSVRDGAEVLIAQTNNADFGRTEENLQQLAIARMRAIETGRALMSVSTVSSTAAIGPDGRTLGAIPSFRPGALVTDLPLLTGTTPAVAFGVQLGIAIAIFGAFAPLIAALARRRRPRQPS
ncbi:apolipoprotein N-acyltransferase [uncultured Amnibacterium sp.]|uniref:apolipoprotein N-acyltransferase n=1 Tax=uncultured Amnibacterium sp. TaxID=1631851 RepID=UPI0035CA2A90